MWDRTLHQVRSTIPSWKQDHLHVNEREQNDDPDGETIIFLRKFYHNKLSRTVRRISDRPLEITKTCDNKISRFYITAEMHKKLWTTKPVVRTSGKIMAGLRKWLDNWLPKLHHQVPIYLRDSSHLIQILTYQGTLPPGAKLFTGDIIFRTNIKYLRTKIIINAWQKSKEEKGKRTTLI